MRNLRLFLITSILVLAIVCSLAGCLTNSADASPALNDGVEEILYTCKITYDSRTAQGTWDQEYGRESLNLTALETPDATYNPGYDFGGWYFNTQYTGTSLDRMDIKDFYAYVDEHGEYYASTNLMHITIYAKWISKSAEKISTAEELVQVFETYEAKITEYMSQNPEMTYEQARRQANNMVFVLTTPIDLSTFDHYSHADEHVLDPDDYDSEAEMQEEADKLKVMYENSWVPIAGGVGECFGATFDGNGYEISGMKIIVTDHDADPEFNYIPVGLFGKVSGTVKNVNLVDYTIQMDGDVSRFYVGGVVGWNSFYEYEDTSRQYGRVEGCSSTGNIANLEIEYTGNMWDSLFGSYAEPTSQVYFGGVIGYLEEATAVKLSSNGKITSESNADEVYLGGIVGYNYKGRLETSNANVYVRGRYAGGVVGYNNGTISTSYALGDVEGSLSYPAIAGGLVAYNYVEGKIDQCYAEGNAKARTAGGLVGVNVFDYATAAGGTVKNAYALGDVFASEYAGGLIGRATADLPIFGRQDFHPSIFDDGKEYSATSDINVFAIVENCLAYGDVEANATETEFKDDKGNVVNASVYYSVFAGSLFGQSYEQLVKGCVAFGDATAISNRPKNSEIVDDLTYNTAFAGNFAGQTTNNVLGADYRAVYALEDILITKNGSPFKGTYLVEVVDPESGETIIVEKTYPNMVTKKDVSWFNAASNYYDPFGMAFDTNIWNLNGLDVENGIYPTLKGV